MEETLGHLTREREELALALEFDLKRDGTTLAALITTRLDSTP